MHILLVLLTHELLMRKHGWFKAIQKRPGGCRGAVTGRYVMSLEAGGDQAACLLSVSTGFGAEPVVIGI